MPRTHSVFQRLPIAEGGAAFEETESLLVRLLVRLLAGRRFHNVLGQHMGYWECRIPQGQGCFVHYAIGAEGVIAAAFARLRAEGGWGLVGMHHVEPQHSAYPAGFPLRSVPDPWHLEECAYTKDSIFWFNFFPEQPYLFEKTFAIWALFCASQLRERRECNQLVAWEGKERLRVQGIDEFVQVNLNRFTSLAGYFGTAYEAGRNTFSVDREYPWYGMLLQRFDGP